MSMESAWSAQEMDTTTSAVGAQPSQSFWSKRLSTFSSEGSIDSSQRPQSAAISQSNGSIAFSNAGSTAPIFPSFTPAPVPPNKLVKRSSSVRSVKGGTRIPIPTFKKPATSHERDANLQDLQRRPSTAASSLPFDSFKPEPRGSTWKTYFTPKVSFQSTGNITRRSSTSIPNPIKRVIPDRKYHPVLVSGGDNVRPASLDFDRASVEDELPRFSLQRGSVHMRGATKRFFSNPLPVRPSTASTSTTASVSRHSRSDDLRFIFSSSKRDSYHSHLELAANSTGVTSPRPISSSDFEPVPVPKWKRPSKLRASEAKQRRQSTRSSSITGSVTSEPQTVDVEPPNKRRVLSNSSRRSSLLSGNGSVRSPKMPLSETQGNRAVSSQQTIAMQAFGSNGTDQRYSFIENNAPDVANQAVSSPAPASIRSFHARQSGGISEFASSFAGSEGEARFMDDDGFESPNDTLFDSVRTRATSASSTGFKGPRIDAIFDDNYVKPSDKVYHFSTETSFQSPKLRDGFDGPRHSIIEEEEGIATPVRSQRNGSTGQSPETYKFGSSPRANISSSPPPAPVLRRTLDNDFDTEMRDRDDDWDFGEDVQPVQQQGMAKFPQFSDHFSGLHPNLTYSDPSALSSASPSRVSAETANDARSNLFDWAEPQPVDASTAGRSPPRPRTVHGKKDAENRGSRSVGRRAPSGLHVRSQSVPVAPELDGKRSQVVTNKFGTWGVGSKGGIPEDWDEDFDFEESLPQVPQAHQTVGPRHVSEGMQVPKAIQEQQINVLANIGLLRDWGLLIEELKELRGRARSLHLLHNNTSAMWHEVDAMIDLADQESNDHTLAPRQSPPSSPSFDFNAFDEPAAAVPMRNSPRPAPKLHAEDIFESPTQSPARVPAAVTEHVKPRRPRKDSEAVARSVIEALQQRRTDPDPTAAEAQQPSKKVPFDTATLKRIVPYVQELRDQVKKSIREFEGLYASPTAGPEDEPHFSRMFHDFPESPASHRTERRLNGSREHVMSEDSASRSPPDEISRRLELMTVG